MRCCTCRAAAAGANWGRNTTPSIEFAAADDTSVACAVVDCSPMTKQLVEDSTNRQNDEYFYDRQ